MEDVFASLRDVVVEECDYTPFSNNRDFHGNVIPTSCVSLKGYIWITDDKDSRMISPSEDIPIGWKRGRKFTFTEEGKKNNYKQLRDNNPNAKKYKITFRDGRIEICKQLSKWARKNNYPYSSLKSIVRRTKYNENIQFFCKNSPTSDIERIDVL